MSRRTQTFVVGLIVLVLGGLVAALVQVPLVALGPGPTFDALGEVDGKPVVTITGRPIYPTSGHLNLTTVAVTDGLTALTALRFWIDPRREVVPRAAIYPPGKTDEQVEQENTRQFTDSETKAVAAAMGYLRIPVSVRVGEVTAGAPAASVLQPGDQLVRLNGMAITGVDQVYSIVGAMRRDDRLAVGYRRGDGPVSDTVITLGGRPNGQGGTDDAAGFLGIFPEGVPIRPDEVTIKLGDIGGPSAGLAFALATVDKLTPGELTGGRFVAGTGEITSDGRVAAIGGIGLKMRAAREAGATVFLVPAANCEQAMSADHSGLQLAEVSTLTDAVAALTALNEGRVPKGC